MTLTCRAAVLHTPKSPLVIENVEVGEMAPEDVLVRVKAVGLCHTDLEVIEGELRQPLPIVLGHEAAGIVEQVGSAAHGVAIGNHVVLSWNPHCGHCFYCDRNLPILCEPYVGQAAKAAHFDGRSRARLRDGRDLHHLMYLGGLADYCVVPAQQAIVVPNKLPFDQACLIGCGVMTGVGAALNLATLRYGDNAVVVGCGAVGLAAVQGARMAGATRILAVDLDNNKLDLASRLGATHVINAAQADVIAAVRKLTEGRGADVVLEAAGSEQAFRTTTEVVRPGGEIIWLGKTDVTRDVAFRWGSLMQEKRIRRSSYGGARPKRDFPKLAQAALDGRLKLDEMITGRISLDQVNEGFAALRNGTAIRSVVML